MDEPADYPVDVDIMDVSPALHPDPVPQDDKENETDIDSAPILTRVKPLTVASNPAPPATDDDNGVTGFTYVLRKYNTIVEKKVYSPWHYFGGFRWRLLIFPKGNQATSNNDISVFLECGGPSNGPTDPLPSFDSVSHISAKGKEAVVPSIPPTSWSRPAKFSLHLLHPSSPIAISSLARDNAQFDRNLPDLDVLDSNLSSAAHTSTRSDIIKDTSHVFRDTASDWGFREFAQFSILQPTKYADDDMNVTIMVRIRLQDSFPDPMFANNNTWDSKKETGFVGFKNQGATCYMNSLLQTLYMLSAFRKAVYSMPLPEPGNELSGSELSYALQKVFYELQTSPTVVKTKNLTKSFGWDTTDAFTQHDVQELKLILCDELAEKMKKIAPHRQNTLSTLFLGKLHNYIECVNVNYKSTREEDFSDLSLNVKGCRNVYDSFEKYTEVEMLEGDNKYCAEGFQELQNARKGIKFLKLPLVLQLHLKRVDFAGYTAVKINDRYEFETELNLSRFVENSDGTDIYMLQAVLVHSGDVNGGHYHVFIRPDIDLSDDAPRKPSQWFKFDDEAVTLATENAAVADNFGVGGEKDIHRRGPGLEDDLSNGGVNGGQTLPPNVFQTRSRQITQSKRLSNAYMLQYLRKSDIPYLLKPQSESDVPKELSARINKEREEEEQRKRDLTQQHLYMYIAVATNEDMVAHHGADLVNWEKVRQLRVKRALQLGELKARLQHEGLVRDAHRMRLWKCSGRQNDTIRPDSLVAGGLESLPITDSTNRDPLTTSYNVPLYAGRHGYYGQEDIVRMFAEDLCSPFCRAPGQSYTSYINAGPKVNGVGRTRSNSPMADGRTPSDIESESVHGMPSFPLVRGKEVLLFLKFYSPSPIPRLQWLGHLVVDRSMTVKELHPKLLDALGSYRQQDRSLPGIEPGASLSVFEEVSAVSISSLRDDRTLEQQRIPLDSGSGDILVFQQDSFRRKLEDGSRSENVVWNGLQEPSCGDGTDLPLGGRPLLYLVQYFDYLVHRIKIGFRDKHAIGGPNEAKSIFFELLRKDSYRTARSVLAGELGKDVNPDYIRFFTHDFNREAPTAEPLRIGDDDPLERVLPIHSLMNSGQTDYRVLWYERTEYHISEFEEKDEVRVVWRADGGTRSTPFGSSGVVGAGTIEPAVNNVVGSEISLKVDANVDDDSLKNSNGAKSPKLFPWATEHPDGSKSFSVLVPAMSTYLDVMRQVRSKLKIDARTEIRMFEVKNSKNLKFIDPCESVPPIMTAPHDCSAELRAEPVPSDETEESLGGEYQLVTVLHLAKDKQPRVWRGLTFFGVPFVIRVKKTGELVRTIRKRIQEKLGVASELFDQWPLAEISHLKAYYLNDLESTYTPNTSSPIDFLQLAVEHKSTAPVKRTSSTMSRYADKPLKIRS